MAKNNLKDKQRFTFSYDDKLYKFHEMHTCIVKNMICVTIVNVNTFIHYQDQFVIAVSYECPTAEC